MHLTAKQYGTTTGLRTKEFLAHLFTHFNIDATKMAEAEKVIVTHVIDLVKQKGSPMQGVSHIINFFSERHFKIGLATSSAPALINVVIDRLDIRNRIQAISSADHLPYGKPHPEVYLECASKLGVHPNQCICFEDSFNGMIAAKAAKMKCIIVPSQIDHKNPVWEAADLKISTLHNFNELLLDRLQKH